MADSDRISPTAHYTGYAWRVLGLPHAELFETRTGRFLHRGYRLISGRRGRGELPLLLRTLRNRHLRIDQALTTHQPDVVVELGAGLSQRGVTFAEQGVRYVELDLPPMARLKRRLLTERAPDGLQRALAGRFTVTSADILSGGFVAELEALLNGARRPAVIAEGVIGYFEAEQRQHILTSVAQAIPRGSDALLLVDLRVKGEGNEADMVALRRAIRLATRGRGAAPSFQNEAEARACLSDGGFRDVERLPQWDDSVPLMSAVFAGRAG